MWKWISIAIIIVIFIVLAILLSRIRLKLEIAKHDNDDRAHLEIRFLYGLIKMDYDIPAILITGLKKGFSIGLTAIKIYIKRMLLWIAEILIPKKSSNLYMIYGFCSRVHNPYSDG